MNYGQGRTQDAELGSEEVSKTVTWSWDNDLSFFACFVLFLARKPQWPRTSSQGFQITHDDTTQSVGILWISDQLVAETST